MIWGKERAAEKGVDQKVDAKMKVWEETQKKRTDDQRKADAETITKQKVNFSRQWYDLVQQGKMTKPADELMEKLKANEQITEEEASKDRGLQEYRRLVKTALEKKSDNLKVTYYEDFNKEPAGMDAPVMGGDNVHSTEQNQEEYTYEEIRGK